MSELGALGRLLLLGGLALAGLGLLLVLAGRRNLGRSPGASPGRGQPLVERWPLPLLPRSYRALSRA
jgi:hypothetical protein